MSLQIFATAIVADQPTVNGNVYSKEAMERAIKAFNIAAKNGPVPGSILDRTHIQRNEPVTHRTHALFLNESGVLCAQIEIQDPELIKKIKDGAKIAARPILAVPSSELDRSPLRVTTIEKIIRIQLECSDEPE